MLFGKSEPMKSFIFFLNLLLLVSPLVSQDLLYRNPRAPVEQRVADLLSRMTLEEKLWQLFMIPGGLEPDNSKYKNGIFGLQVATRGTSSGVSEQLLRYEGSSTASAVANEINALQRWFVQETRLAIPIIPFDEALHGLVRDGATAFPQAIALAATWNPELVHQVAMAIAKETRSRGIRQVLSPVVNMATDVRWGRVEETYGEDPLLCTAMALAFVTAFEQNGIITTPKHFVANVGDGGRDSYPVYLSERLLAQLHFPPFKACFQQGGSRSVMTSYNSLNGMPCSAQDWLLNQKLKKEWGFDGFVMADAGAVPGMTDLHGITRNYPQSATLALNNGLDVIFQTDYSHFKLLFDSTSKNIDARIIDAAVSRVLKVKFELGLFENPYCDPAEADRLNAHPAHRELAKKAALESIVLLKNKNRLLPLQKHYAKIAVIGVDAQQARLGGYSGPGVNKISILDGIKNCVDDKTVIQYHPGCGRQSVKYVTVPSRNLTCISDGKKQDGLRADYFDNIELQAPAAFTRVDPVIDFSWTLFSPRPDKLERDWYSVRWSGTLLAPQTGKFKIGLQGNDGYRLYIDDRLLIDHWEKVGYQTRLVDFDFVQNRAYRIKVEFFEGRGNAHLNLVWNLGVKDDHEQTIAEAVQLAASSDLAIVVPGIEEGEFRDRALLGLPGYQEELIKQVAGTGKPVVVVLVAGSAVTMSNWLDQADAVLDVWYPGEQGGHAVADVLFGRYNPAGRLPITFPQHEAQLPLYYNHAPTGRGDDYVNLTGEPLFPFGYGLSYSEFVYARLQIDLLKDSVRVACDIANAGGMDGDEVVQLYIKDMCSSMVRPVIELADFKRVHIKAGQRRTVVFRLPPAAFSLIDETLSPILERGEYKILLGRSSRDIRLSGKVVL